ncbi:MAG: L,D-transpeptidase family protein [Prevotellaceae bacterium]|jgi:murein L,D-transpeptidase YcbB/YkuD|nr:L,D-transpeptidase family protein [Prevotellaceae bacterium]
MKNTQHFFILPLLLLLLFCSCSNNKNIEKHWFDDYSFFSNDNYQRFFAECFDEKQQDSIIFSFYKNQNFTPFFTENGYNDARIDTLLFFLNNAQKHGLSPKAFDYQVITTEIDTLKNYAYKDTADLYSALCRLENLLTTNYLKYAKTIYYGVAKPATANGGKWHYKQLLPDSAFYAACFANMDKFADFLTSIHPADFHYLALQKELEKYVAFGDTVFPKIEHFNVDSGAVNKAVLQVAERLAFFNLLDSAQAHTDTFNLHIINALNIVRKKHNIPESAKLDKEAVNLLNLNPRFYVEKIALNLERLRWKTENPKGKNYIAVNIPDFTLRTFLADTLALTMKVCCGSTEPSADSIKARTTKNNIIMAADKESPLLYSEINHLILNPQWNVPNSIIEKEYFGQISTDAGKFLDKNAMLFYDSKGNYVPHDSIDWTKINPKKFPYRLVQKSSRGGSLGVILFRFPNPFSVYLHDTPTRSAFNYNNRAVSHGCIRIEKPMELAQLLFAFNSFDAVKVEKIKIDLGENPKSSAGKKYLKDKDEKETKYYNNLSDEQKLIYQKKRPSKVDFDKTMPLYIEYFTCISDENGEVYFFKDVYFKDRNLTRLLKNYLIE